MPLNACGSIHIHQGHEWVILVMTLEEDKIFLCVWLLYYVSNFCRFANGARCQDIDQVLLHRDNFLLSAFSSICFSHVSFRQNFIWSKLPTAVCSLREKREEGVKSTESTCFMSKASQIICSILRLLRR